MWRPIIIAACSLGLALIVVFHSQAVSAQESAFALEYEAPSLCPMRADFVDRVAESLGYSPFRQTGTDQDGSSVRVIIETDDHVLSATLSIRDRGSEATRRTIEAGLGECALLVDTLAGSAGLALDELQRAKKAQGTELKQATNNEPKKDSIAPRILAEPTEVKRSPYFGRVMLGIRSSFLSTPNPAVGGHVGGGLINPFWSLELRGQATSTLQTHAVGRVGVDARIYSLTLSVCGRLAPVHLCADVLGGAFEGYVGGVEGSRSRFSPHLAAGVRGGATVSFTERWGLGASLGLLANLTRMSVFSGDQMVFSMPTFSVFAEIELLMSFK